MSEPLTDEVFIRCDPNTAFDPLSDVRNEDGGTKLVVTTDVRPKGLAAALSPLLRLFRQRELARRYQTVKQVCEAESNPSSG